MAAYCTLRDSARLFIPPTCRAHWDLFPVPDSPQLQSSTPCHPSALWICQDCSCFITSKDSDLSTWKVPLYQPNSHYSQRINLSLPQEKMSLISQLSHYILTVAYIFPDRGLNLQPRHVPWLGIEPVTLGFAGLCSIHRLHQPGQLKVSFDFFLDILVKPFFV